uniref:Carboxypeptidase n=1 Tax=Plectus sambesii TaxID=2011161 RepID=A0A914UR39_9BILA
MSASDQLKTYILLFSSLTAIVLTAPLEDLVTSLPGLNFNPSFKHYSGYLDATTVNSLHYWFVESERNPATDPVLLWLNGGPDCSSLFGLFAENGPFQVVDEGNSLNPNIYSWNKFANVIYLEAPAGVGFSYAKDNSLNRTDDQTADDNYAALVVWMNKKFPEYKKNDFYVTGESYASVYIPTLAVRLINDTANFPNFKGIAIGNGRMHVIYNDNSLIPFLFNHGLIRQGLWDKVSQTCCNGNPYNCDYHSLFHNLGSQQCNDWVSTEHVSFNGLDPYNMYGHCYLPSGNGYMATILAHRLKEMGANVKDSPATTYPPLCDQDLEQTSANYLNQPAVRTQLHIPASLPPWTTCTDALHYVGNHFDLTDLINQIADAGVRVLLYSGDADTICNTVHTSIFTSKLGRQVLDADPDSTHTWLYNGEDPNIAGFITRYSGGVDFLTVRGSGHMVPKDKPREAQQLIYNFINNRNYSTPIDQTSTSTVEMLFRSLMPLNEAFTGN